MQNAGFLMTRLKSYCLNAVSKSFQSNFENHEYYNYLSKIMNIYGLHAVSKIFPFPFENSEYMSYSGSVFQLFSICVAELSLRCTQSPNRWFVVAAL